MQTKSKEKINIVTLGCAKNIVDSEVLLTQLKEIIEKLIIKEMT